MIPGLDATLARVAADLDAGAILALQRVPRAATADGVAEALSARLNRPVRVAHAFPDDVPDLAVFDARALPVATFDAWDPARASLVAPGGARVVLLDVTTGIALLQRAPHTASFAGGVAMPAPGSVRGAQTEQEALVGDDLLRRWAAQHPEHAHGLVGIDLASERVFFPTADANPVEVAREHLDEGVIYVGMLP